MTTEPDCRQWLTWDGRSARVTDYRAAAEGAGAKVTITMSVTGGYELGDLLSRLLDLKTMGAKGAKAKASAGPR